MSISKAQRESRRFEGTVTIKVTKDAIVKGKPQCSTACAVACAVAATGATRPLVHGGKLAFTSRGRRYYYEVTPKLKSFIHDYDMKDGKALARPASFTLRDGWSVPAGRTGATDKTQHTRRQKGGRAARKGFTGKRSFYLTKDRVGGMSVHAVKTA